MTRYLISAVVLLFASGGPAGSHHTGGTGESPVRVFDVRTPKAELCARVDTSGPFVRGGCTGRANVFIATTSIRTVFSRMRFGNCGFDFDFTLGADGRVWMDDLKIGGASPCSDLRPCASRAVLALRKLGFGPAPRDKVRPWTGRVLSRAADGYNLRFRMCVDTCLGRYAGDIDMTLVRDGDGWLMRAESAGVGDTGFEIDGEIKIPALRADIRGG